MSHHAAENSFSFKKPVTFSEFQPGDLTYLFRRQYSRSLSEVDELLQRQEYIRGKLGNEKANEIEANPDLFYNHERFRIWQAKARFRALLTSMVVFPALTTMAAGGRDGLGLVKRRPFLGVPLFAVVYAGSFFAWHRVVGYNSQSYFEQNYAKNHKMLRNLIIKQ